MPDSNRSASPAKRASSTEFSRMILGRCQLPRAKVERVLDSARLTEFAGGYAAIAKQLHVTDNDLKKTKADYAEHVEWASRKVGELEGEMAKRLEWGHAIEKDSDQHIAHIAQLQSSDRRKRKRRMKTHSWNSSSAPTWALSLQQENESLTGRCDAFENNSWLRLGRRLRLAKASIWRRLRLVK